MFSFIITLIIIVSLLLILVVLAQNSKGSGVSSQFGGSTTSQMIGVKKTGNFLEKLTWGLAMTLIVLSLVSSNFAKDRNQSDVLNNPILEKAQESATMPTIAPQEGLGTSDSVPANEQE